MPNRVQTLRSSVPGNMPQAATRAPGELWVNFADAHLGYIDAGQTAQKLLAVRLFVNTANYATGDFVVYAGALYQAVAPSTAGAFTAANWTKIGTAQDLSQYLLLAGGTLTGALNLPATAPTVATQATNKSYVDAGDAATLAAANTNANTKLPLAGGALTGALNGTTATFSGAVSAGSVSTAGSVSAVTAAFSGLATAADPPAADSSGNLVTTRWFNGHQPVTKDNSNRIINGDCRLDQRNNGAGGTAGGIYTIDRWLYGNNTGAVRGTWGRTSNVALLSFGFGYCLSFTSSSAYTPAAADTVRFIQPVEADLIADFAWGTAQAQPVTLSFLVYSSLTGTFGGVIQNYPAPATRSYPFTFNIPTANTWTKIVITIPGDTAGTWVMSGNSGGLYVVFDLGSGATSRGPAGAWASANYYGANGAVSVVGTNGATVYLTGIKLEIGSIATPFIHQTMAKSLIDCQRYYQVLALLVAGFANAGIGIYVPMTLLTTMRAAPTGVIGPVTGPQNCTSQALAIVGPSAFYHTTTVTVTGACTFQVSPSFSAEL